MNCMEFDQTLNECIESRRPAGVGPMREHAANCRACGKRWELEVILWRAIPIWKDQTPAVDLVDGVLGKLAFDDQRSMKSVRLSCDVAGLGEADSRTQDSIGRVHRRMSPQQTGWQSIAILVTVASLLFMLAFTLARPVTVDQNIPPSGGQIAADNIEADNPLQQSNQDEPEIDSLLRDAGSAYLVLAEGAAHVLTDARMLLPPTDFNDSEFGSDQDSSNQRASGSGKWRRELQHLGRDLENAVDFLLDAVPAQAVPTI